MINQASHRAGFFMQVNNSVFYYLGYMIKHSLIIHWGFWHDIEEIIVNEFILIFSKLIQPRL
jgi:hypothetical protein